jgi:hypothetical protein
MSNFKTLDELLETLSLLVVNSFDGWSATINCGQEYHNLTFNSTTCECEFLNCSPQAEQHNIPSEGGFLCFEDLTKKLETIKSSFDNKTVTIMPTISSRNKYPHLTVQLTKMKEFKCYDDGLKRFDQDLYINDLDTYQISPMKKVYKFIVPDYHMCKQMYQTAILFPLVFLPTLMLVKKLGLKV